MRIIIAISFKRLGIIARAMAEGGLAEERKVRCRKCRHTLLEEPPHRMMARKEEDEHVIPLYEDQLPDWMAEAVQEVRLSNSYVTAVDS